MKNGVTLRKSEILVFILFLPLYRPPYLATDGYAFLDPFFVYGKIISFFVALLIYGKQLSRKSISIKNKQSIGVLCYLMFFISLFVSAVINRNLEEIGSAFLPIITSVILFLGYKNKDITMYLKPLKYLLGIYVIINFVTVVIFPDGLYTASVNEMSTRSEYCWFLGYRNPQIRLILPAIATAFICDIYEKNQIRFSDKILLICSSITVVLIKSSTAIVGMLIFIIIYLLRLKKSFYVKPIWFIIWNGIFFVGIVIFRFQNSFSFIITELLHRDITFTGRTVIWDLALLKFLQSPIWGTGATQFPIGQWFTATHPHNFILYILLKSGIVGLIFLFISILISCKNLYEYRHNKVTQIIIMEFCALFSMAVVESMTEGVYFWLVIIMGICCESMCKEEEDRRELYVRNCDTF